MGENIEKKTESSTTDLKIDINALKEKMNSSSVNENSKNYSGGEDTSKNNSPKNEYLYTVPVYMQSAVENTDNTYFLLHRYLFWNIPEPPKDNKDRKSKDRNIIDKSNKLKSILFVNTKKSEEALKNSIDIANKANAALCDMFSGEIYETKTFSMKQTWNMVVGLGTTSVSETSMTLHHIYGTPYIPGQTLKGIVRSFIIREYFGNDENAAMNDDVFAYIFGCDDTGGRDAKKGKVMFFDAFPSNGDFDVDIMNNHHTQYYNGDKANLLNDTEAPIPIKMLVLKNAEFTFRISIKTKDNACAFDFTKKNVGSWLSAIEKENVSTNILSFIVGLLKQTLEMCGVGAKTAVGYGLFENNKMTGENANE